MLVAFFISLAAGIIVLNETGSILAAIAIWLMVGSFFIYSAGNADRRR